MDHPEFQDLINSQRAFFASGATKTLAFRREQLRKLRRMVAENETVLFNALKQDLQKRSIVKRGFFFDVRLRFPPYRDHLRLVKKFY